MSDLTEFQKALRDSLKRNEEVFESSSENKKYLDDLLGLSTDEINSVVPNGTNSKTYADLISVVKEATRHNVSQAQLITSIKKLGTEAVTLAKQVSSLAVLL